MADDGGVSGSGPDGPLGRLMMMVIKCVLYVESAYPHFVTAGLCWPNPAKIPELICQIIFRSIFLLLSVRRAKSKDSVCVIYTRKFCFCWSSLRNSSFSFSLSFVLVSDRNFTPTSVWYLCVCVTLHNSCFWSDTPATLGQI